MRNIPCASCGVLARPHSQAGKRDWWESDLSEIGKGDVQQRQWDGRVDRPERLGECVSAGGGGRGKVGDPLKGKQRKQPQPERE